MTEKLLPAGTAASKKSFTQLPLPLLANGERLLQFIWQFGYFNKAALATTCDEPVSILFPGSLNKNAGPDFTAAKIKIGETTFAGSVEIHFKTSDWIKHRHNCDAHYNNVILHAVYEHDETVNDVPVLELSSRLSTLLLERYAAFMDNFVSIPCAGSIGAVKELVWKGWKERLLIERLTRKASQVLRLFEQSGRHWEETFWWSLARAFGGTVNGDAFEAVARTVPVNLLARHKSSLHQLEALLMGGAGLLNADFEDDYPKMLNREYDFLAKKYGLQPSSVPVLFLRMRPGNFPTVRLAQLAVLLHQSAHLFSRVLEAEDLPEVKACFAVTANDFWHYHYTFGQPSAFKKKTVGDDTACSIIINTVVPLLFAYGLYHNLEASRNKALRWLDELSAENNSITKEFHAAGIRSTTAYDSQALLQLKNAYCAEKRCLECSVGVSILREAAAEYKPVSP